MLTDNSSIEIVSVRLPGSQMPVANQRTSTAGSAALYFLLASELVSIEEVSGFSSTSVVKVVLYPLKKLGRQDD